MNELDTQSGVVLSFDDYQFIPDWVDVIDLFSEYDAKATFFIHAPDKISQSGWEGLKKLVANSHAVGCHSMCHERAVDYCDKHGVDAWIENEVSPALDILTQHGFDVASFAYPCSQDNIITDEALRPCFKHARTGVGLPEGKRFADLDTIFKPVENIADCFLCPAKGIDHLEDVTLIEEAVSRAAIRNELFFLLGHRIGVEEEGKDNRILTDKNVLREILRVIKSHDLKFYTFNDLA